MEKARPLSPVVAHHDDAERADVQRVLAFEDDDATETDEVDGSESDSEQPLVFADAQTDASVSVVGVVNGLLQVLQRAVVSLSTGLNPLWCR